jgi:hypothetical protein
MRARGRHFNQKRQTSKNARISRFPSWGVPFGHLVTKLDLDREAGFD